MNKGIRTSNAKGITLVSLVVTIIILIIIAGITISTTIGNNGIITKARQSKDATRIAQIKEDIGVDLLYAQMETNGASLSDKKIEEIVSKYGKLEDDKDTITTNEGYKISLTEIYKGTTGSGSTGSSKEDAAKIKLLEERIKTLEAEKAKLQESLDSSNLSNEEKDTKITELNSNITKLKKEISDGKTAIATAITNKGVATDSKADFNTLATNIEKIGGGYKYIKCTGKLVGDDQGTVTFNLKDYDSTATEVIDYMIGGTSLDLQMGVNSAPPWWVNGRIASSRSGFLVSVWGGNNDSNTWHTRITNLNCIFIYR